MNRNQPLMLVRTLAALLLGLFVASTAQAYPPREWRFNVLLDDKPIGQHVFRLTLEDGMQVLRNHADFNVRFLGFSAYRYQHTATERWQGGCLAGIDAGTHDNGRSLKLTGKKQEAGFVLSGTNGATALPGCVMSFAYWNPAILRQSRLLNAETGDYLPVEVQPLGKQSLSLPGKQVIAKRYRLRANGLGIDLWYSASDQWLALETTTTGGRTLRYVIEPAFYTRLHDTRYA